MVRQGRARQLLSARIAQGRGRHGGGERRNAEPIDGDLRMAGYQAGGALYQGCEPEQNRWIEHAFATPWRGKNVNRSGPLSIWVFAKWAKFVEKHNKINVERWGL
jgi:hypothetical protein